MISQEKHGKVPWIKTGEQILMPKQQPQKRFRHTFDPLKHMHLVMRQTEAPTAFDFGIGS